jgi:hypothetical protein
MVNRMPLESLSASFLFRSLTTNGFHPHLLLDCTSREVECVRLGLEQWGALPITYCRLPGPLMLPRYGKGTLLLDGLHFMNITQQHALYEWMRCRPQNVQIISVTAGVIDELVAKGMFLQSLFAKLSSVRVDARAHDRVSVELRAS